MFFPLPWERMAEVRGLVRAQRGPGNAAALYSGHADSASVTPASLDRLSGISILASRCMGVQYGTVNGKRVAYRHGHCETFLLYSPLALFWREGSNRGVGQVDGMKYGFLGRILSGDYRNQ